MYIVALCAGIFLCPVIVAVSLRQLIHQWRLVSAKLCHFGVKASIYRLICYSFIFFNALG